MFLWDTRHIYQNQGLSLHPVHSLVVLYCLDVVPNESNNWLAIILTSKLVSFTDFVCYGFESGKGPYLYIPYLYEIVVVLFKLNAFSNLKLIVSCVTVLAVN